MKYRAVLVASLIVAGACASAPPKPPAPPTISADQKMSWILRLEDRRILRDPAPPPAPVVAAPVTRKGKPALPPPAPVVVADLTTLVSDSEPRIRRRAALAIGRVGLADGAAAVKPLLADADAEVRQMAAFALGLLGDQTSV